MFTLKIVLSPLPLPLSLSPQNNIPKAFILLSEYYNSGVICLDVGISKRICAERKDIMMTVTIRNGRLVTGGGGN